MLLKGKILSPGLGEGKTFIHFGILASHDGFYEIEKSQVEEELLRFVRAVDRISKDLTVLAGQVKNEIDSDLSGIFQAHIAMVQDKALNTEVKEEIKAEQVSAGMAVKTVFRRWERRFRLMEAEIARQKGDDIRDLARRLIYSIAGIHSHILEKLPPCSVIVAQRLLPSDTIYLARRTATAAIVELGGAGSHAALFAREIGLPCIAGIKGAMEKIPSGVSALVDANAGEIIIEPDAEMKKQYHLKCEKLEKALSKARLHAREPAVTKKGKRINVLANIGSENDSREAVKNGTDGVGLYRIERIYLGCQAPPSTETLLKEMQKTLEPVKGLPVCIRLLDIGADKPLPFMESLREINPALGRRGIRFLTEYPTLLQTQLEAVLKLSDEYDLNILVPMVTLPEDIREIKETLVKTASKLGIKKIPRLGAMIETPAAALAAADLLQYADFLSFGTNDLTQYSFAVDRENAAVDRYFDDTHKVIFRLLKIVHDDVPDMPLSLCGELAGRPEYVQKILKCGIDSLSVAPPLIPSIKEAVRQVEDV